MKKHKMAKCRLSTLIWISGIPSSVCSVTTVCKLVTVLFWLPLFTTPTLSPCLFCNATVNRKITYKGLRVWPSLGLTKEPPSTDLTQVWPGADKRFHESYLAFWQQVTIEMRKSALGTSKSTCHDSGVPWLCNGIPGNLPPSHTAALLGLSLSLSLSLSVCLSVCLSVSLSLPLSLSLFKYPLITNYPSFCPFKFLSLDLFSFPILCFK